MAKKSITEEEFPSNSNTKQKAPIREDRTVEKEVAFFEPPKKSRRPIKGKATLKKKSFIQTIASAFIGESTDNVGGYILHEVLIPAAKNTIQEMVQSGIEMLLFGERQSRKPKDRGSTKISYGSYYKDRDDHRDRPRASYRDKFDLSEIYFKDHNDAEDVLSNLCDTLEEYEQVTVADFFDLAGIDGATWAHHKYGWTDLRRAYNTHTRGGWQIVFPDPVELD